MHEEAVVLDRAEALDLLVAAELVASTLSQHGLLEAELEAQGVVRALLGRLYAHLPEVPAG